VSRRLIVVVAGVLALGIGGGIAIAVLASGGGAATATSDSGAQPLELHPVAGNFKPDGTQLSSCKEDARCFEQAFGNLSYYEGPKPAIKLFAKEMAANKTVEADCHRIAHSLGNAALARFKGNVSEAFSKGDSICWSGYYHGILERAFLAVKTKSQLISTARSVCDDPDLRNNTWLLYQCVHGLGHGLMIVTAYSLPFSLEVCGKLATAWDQTSCTGGVYMENVNAANGTSIGYKTKWVKSNDLVYPCDAPVTKGKRLYCYLMVTSRILAANGYNWQATAQICSKVDRNWVATCFQSYGRDADGFTRQNPTEVKRLCSIAGRFADQCIYGAARDMTSNYSGGTKTAVLCRTVASSLRAICFNGIGTILGSLHADTSGRRSACVELTRTYLADCLSGAGVSA
jgi:hypothetical protein